MGPATTLAALLFHPAHGAPEEDQVDQPLERSFDADMLAHLPPESFGAPAWRLLGPADAPSGALGPTLHWQGLVIAGSGDPLPLLPIGSVAEIKAIAAPTGGDLWAPGGRAMEVRTGLPEGGALQIGWPTPRIVGRMTAHAEPGIRWGAAADITGDQGAGLATLTALARRSELELLAAGAGSPDGSDALAGARFSEERLGSTLAVVARVFTDDRDQRLYRVGAAARLHRDPRTGLSAGLEVEHWGRNLDLTRRAGLWLQDSHRSRFADVVAAVRVDLQERVGARIDERSDVSPRVHVRLHTAAELETGIHGGISRSAGALAPVGDDLAETEQFVVGVDQRIPGSVVIAATGTLTRIGSAEAVAIDVGIDRRVQGLSWMAHVAAGEWTEGGQGLPWASAVGVATVDVDLILPTRLGVAARWRSPGEAPAPVGAVGWLDGLAPPHADAGGRAVVALPVGRAGQAVEVEFSGWSRAVQLPLLPRADGRGDRLRPATARGEAALRYAW